MSGVNIRQILLPTDLETGFDRAFGHALRLAVGAQGELTVVHVRRDPAPREWRDHPDVRQTLTRWGVLAEEASVEDYTGLGLKVRFKTRVQPDAIAGVLVERELAGSDLVVMSTHAREGLSWWLRGSVSEEIARIAKARTLFLPQDGRGFIDPNDGAVSLTTVVIPVETGRAPTEELAAFGELAALLGVVTGRVVLVHSGELSEVPDVEVDPGWEIELVVRQSGVVDNIVDVVGEVGADLVVMGTRGHDSLGDALWGSRTERVLHKVWCPLLSVPLS
jgi:nucleotide-binding universal stress UspA family protein